MLYFIRIMLILDRGIFMKNNKKFIYIFMIIFLVMFGFKTIVLADGLSCNSWGTVLQDLQNVFDFVKIVVPLLIIGLSTYDFIKAVTAKDDKGLKKAFQILLKRLVYAIILFFLPVLINLLLELVAVNSNVCIE